MNNIKAIIFDADGMIVHGERFSKRLEKEYGISTEVTGDFFKNTFSLCLIGKADLKDELLKNIKKWKWSRSIDALLEFWFDEAHSMIEEKFFQVIPELRKKGIKTYLATNNEKYRTENLINERKLGTLFDDVFSSYKLGSKKPEKEFFQYILDSIGFAKEEIIFWDDDIENIEGAKEFGLPTEQYKDFDQFANFLLFARI